MTELTSWPESSRSQPNTKMNSWKSEKSTQLPSRLKQRQHNFRRKNPTLNLHNNFNMRWGWSDQWCLFNMQVSIRLKYQNPVYQYILHCLFSHPDAKFCCPQERRKCVYHQSGSSPVSTSSQPLLLPPTMWRETTTATTAAVDLKVNKECRAFLVCMAAEGRTGLLVARETKEKLDPWDNRVNQPSLRDVCLFLACLTSQQHASVSQGRICTDNFTCCHTEIGAADPTFHLTQSQYTDTGPTSPSADPIKYNARRLAG